MLPTAAEVEDTEAAGCAFGADGTCVCWARLCGTRLCAAQKQINKQDSAAENREITEFLYLGRASSIVPLNLPIIGGPAARGCFAPRLLE